MLLDHPSCFFVCLATFKNQTNFSPLISPPLNANARERYPFVVRYYWQQKAKKQGAFLHRRFTLSSFYSIHRGKERERERRESDRRLCVRCYSCALNYDLFLFPENLSSFLFFVFFFRKRAQTKRDERERERESSIADMNDLLVTNEQGLLFDAKTRTFSS